MTSETQNYFPIIKDELCRRDLPSVESDVLSHSQDQRTEMNSDRGVCGQLVISSVLCLKQYLNWFSVNQQLGPHRVNLDAIV